MSVQELGVVGSGTMGRGIAIAVAMQPVKVHIYDLTDEILTSAIGKIESTIDRGIEKGKINPDNRKTILERIQPTTTYDSMKNAEIVIEAVPESIELKRSIFQSLANTCASDTVFASNTSSLSITAIASGLKNPERVAGIHFFNPANIMKLVEVVQSKFTSNNVVTQLCGFAEFIGKMPVKVKDTPGFIVNRVARSFYSESLRILEENVSDVATIDEIIRGHGFKMGPFQLMDLIGNDVNFEVTKTLYETYHGEPRYRPSQIQKSLIDAGLLGRKTGQGFYLYEK